MRNKHGFYGRGARAKSRLISRAFRRIRRGRRRR